jgi:hypothetical protein
VAGHGQPLPGAERRLHNPDRPFTPGGPQYAEQRSLGRITSVPAVDPEQTVGLLENRPFHLIVQLARTAAHSPNHDVVGEANWVNISLPPPHSAAPKGKQMTHRTFGLPAIALVLFALAPHTQAAVQRTFVSTSGVNNPACSLAAPCRDFATAIATTSLGGEVIVLDSGGYGGATIAQSVSITAPTGVYAGISVFGGDGITINAGASDIVKLRGLTLNGLGGANGIVVNSVGLLEIDDVRVSGFSFRGLDFAAPNGRLTVTNSVFENSGESGLHAQTTSGTATITLDRSRFDHNAANGAVIATHVTGSILNSTASHNASVGFLIDAGGIATLANCKVSDTYDFYLNYGILVRGATTRAMISNCDVFGAFNGYAVDSGAYAQVADSTAQSGGGGFEVLSGASEMYAERSTATNNQVGFGTSGGTTGKLTLSNCTSTRNNYGVYVGTGTVVSTRQNNTIQGNATPVQGALSPVGAL